MKFVYLLNAMENASAQVNPSNHGYAGHRAKVLDYVAKLEGRVEAAEQAQKAAEERADALLDSECEKILAMPDERVKALIASTGQRPEDAGKLAEQVCTIVLLRHDLDQATRELAGVREALEWIRDHGDCTNPEEMKWKARDAIRALSPLPIQDGDTPEASLSVQREQVVEALEDLVSRCIYIDSYGVEGSDFAACRVCDSSNQPGLLSKPDWHPDTCPAKRAEDILAALPVSHQG